MKELELAQKISKAFQGGKVVFSNYGTEAVIMAIRLACVYTGKHRVGKFEGHYHRFSDQGMISSWFRFGGSKDYPKAAQGTPGTQHSRRYYCASMAVNQHLELLRNIITN